MQGMRIMLLNIPMKTLYDASVLGSAIEVANNTVPCDVSAHECVFYPLLQLKEIVPCYF